MACKIDMKSVTPETAHTIKSKALLKIKNKSSYGTPAKPEFVSIQRSVGDHRYLPFALARSLDLPVPMRLKFPQSSAYFTGTLRSEQDSIKRETIDILQIEHSIIISCYTGFGKTITAICLACKLKFKTLIIVSRLLLLEQWKEAIQRFCSQEKKHSSLVEIITTSSKDDLTMCDFAVINAQNIAKMDPDFLESFGTVIVDEVHQVIAKKTFQNLLHLTPRYLIALSATPRRPDGLDALFPVFFGTNRITRQLSRPHKIFKVNTSFKAVEKRTADGKLDWNAILEDQASNKERNKLIVDIVKDNPERTILILVKRIKHGELLRDAIQKNMDLESQFSQLSVSEQPKVATLFGSNQTFDRSCRVLIGTSAKVGTGFDFDKLDTLILAADVVEYYIQFLGRIMRREDVDPVIFDLVDRNKTLIKHYQERRKVYIQHGGTIENY